MPRASRKVVAEHEAGEVHPAEIELAEQEARSLALAREDSPYVEISGFTLPANVRMPNSDSGCMVGNHFSNNMNTSGVIKRMVYIGNGVIRMWIGDDMRPCLVFSTGMVAEERVV